MVQNLEGKKHLVAVSDFKKTTSLLEFSDNAQHYFTLSVDMCCYLTDKFWKWYQDYQIDKTVEVLFVLYIDGCSAVLFQLVPIYGLMGR